MSPVLEQLPLFVAVAGLILGILLGKKLVSIYTSKVLLIVSLVALFSLIAFNSGGQITGWSIDHLTALGIEFSFAKYTAVAVLSFVSGIGFAFVMGKPTSAPSA
jgi:hypothetical protein